MQIRVTLGDMIDDELYEKLVNSSARGRYHALTHKKMEANLPAVTYSSILEVGGGSGQHVPYVTCGYTRYECTDLKLPHKSHESLDERVLFSVADVEKLEFSDSEFDRVVVTCLLHHLNRPLDALEEIRRVTKSDGLVTILLSSDPGFTFRLVRRLVADRFLIKNGVTDVKLLRAMEHRNHASSLIEMISHVFSKDMIHKKSFPLNGLSWNFTLFFVFQIEIKK